MAALCCHSTQVSLCNLFYVSDVIFFFLRILEFHRTRHLLSYLHHWNIICLVISSVQTENKSGLFVGCPPSNGYSFPSLFGWGGWENPFPCLNICALTGLSQIKNGISGSLLSKDEGLCHGRETKLVNDLPKVVLRPTCQALNLVIANWDPALGSW